MSLLVGNRSKGESGIFAKFKEGKCFLFGRKAAVEFRLKRSLLTIVGTPRKLGRQAVWSGRYKLFNLALTLYDKANNYWLNATRAETRDDLFPEYRREFEAHDTVHDAAGLLRADKILIYLAGVLHSLKHSLLGGVVEGDATSLLLRYLQHLLDVPSDSLTLAVRVACKPNLVGLECLLTERFNQLHLIFFYHIIRSIVIAKINAYAIFSCSFDVADVSFRGHHAEVFTKEFTKLFCLGGRLNNH